MWTWRWLPLSKRSPTTAMLRRAPDGNESDLDSLIQRCADPAQHCQRVPFVIRVLKTADDRRRCADEFGKLSLGKARGRSQFADFAGDLLVRPRLFQVLQPAWLAFVEPTVKDFHCVASWFRHLRHVTPPRKYVSAGWLRT